MKRRAEKDSRKQGEAVAGLAAAFRGVLAPMVLGMLSTKKALNEWVCEFGMAAVVAAMQGDAARIAGPKGKHQKGREYNHWGHTLTPFPYDGREVLLPRPRVRTADGKCEVDVPMVELFQSVDPVAERVVEQILLGVSMRGCDRSLGPQPAVATTRGTKKSKASEVFVEETGKRMEQYLSRRLDELDVIALMLDGVGFASHTVVVAMGITIDGSKHPLGLRLGSTENKRLCIELLQDLQRRGLRIDERILCVIDGGKGLRWAIQDVLGDLAVVQRCTQHKRRNICDHLPRHRRRTVDRMLCDAYKSKSDKSARRRLKQIISWLERNGEVDAASSLREGMEETLTVFKLGLPPALRKFFSTTNGVENMIGTIRRVSRNVTRWRDGAMVKRWATIGIATAEKGFHRIKGHREMPALVIALRGEAHVVDEVRAAG